MPKGITPKAISAKLRTAVTKTAEMPDFKKLMDVQATIVSRGLEEFRKVVQESMAKNAKVGAGGGPESRVT